MSIARGTMEEHQVEIAIMCVRACGLNALVVYFDVKTCDLWEGCVTTRSEF
jgi:hypothetical protein